MAKKKHTKKFEKRKIFAPKRIQHEFEYMKDYSYTLAQFRNLQADPADPMHWTALILLDHMLYKNGAFLIDIRFPREYPFRPPHISFLTQIYHPGVDEHGRICLPCIAAELWKPTTRMDQVIQALVALINDPDPYDAITPKLGREYLQSQHNFCAKALYVTRKFGLPRPKPLKPRVPKYKFGPLAGKVFV